MFSVRYAAATGLIGLLIGISILIVCISPNQNTNHGSMPPKCTANLRLRIVPYVRKLKTKIKCIKTPWQSLHASQGAYQVGAYLWFL